MPNPKGNPQNLLKPKKGERPGGRQKGTKNKLTVEMIEREIARIALSDPLNLFTKRYGRKRTFKLQEIHAMSDDMRACIASVKVRTENLTAGDQVQDQTVEIRLWDKVKALEMCAKHFKWLEDTVKLELSEDVLNRLDSWKARNRAQP